ncbi:MAG: type II toxin-antitoxin system VapC family toxin [Gammaproteobacteria bacterium]|nr:type II toxin-antitoxin system VapC family toxin [Gammaproteobacteria bacterium]
MLIDTDVLIWYMRGNPRAAQALNRIENRTVSTVTYIEIIQGMRNKRELQALRRTFRDWEMAILPIDETISHKAMFYVEQYFHSHSLRLADALIGATAVSHSLKLFTANTKHYRVIADLDLEKFQP